MRVSATLRFALRALGRNKMRSSLTMLGVVIGVAAVITMVAIGQGARSAIQAQISRLGNNLLIIFPGSITQGGVRTGWGSVTTLTAEDAQAIEGEVPLVLKAAPSVRTALQVVYGNQNWFTVVYGVTPEYIIVRDWPVELGRFFSPAEIDGAAKVAVLGKSVVDNLFGGVDPVGEVIRIRKMPFRVIGVLSTKGRNPFGHDQDDAIWIPLTTMQRKVMGITHVGIIHVSAVSPEAIPEAERQIKLLLRARHRLPPGKEDDFNIRNVADVSEAAAESSRIMTILLAGIASVSLLVGGIGIMNIMLVSVTERTREIGIRLAVGARGRDIRFQFLIEALLLSGLGGLLGLVLGVAGAKLVSKMAGWPTLLSPFSIAIAVLFSAAVGIFFGLYPANKAANLDPAQALRYE